MAIHKPLVVISGSLSQLPSGDTLDVAATNLGVLYSLIATIQTVPIRHQYLVSGRIVINATSILRAEGQVVVI